MQNLVTQIIGLADQQIGDNKINSFLPYRKGAKEFDYDAVGCSVLSLLMGSEVKRSFSYDKYKSECLGHLKGKLTNDAVIGDVENMYFANETIAKTAPEFMLLRSQSGDNASTKHLIALFHGFFKDVSLQVVFDSKPNNFIERIFLDILKINLQQSNPPTPESCYLPFVADYFRRDMDFLSRHPDYFRDQLAICIELYTFIYCSQLGLNINNWMKGEEPSSQPLYFILDTERASIERTEVMKYGYKQLAEKMADVFPKLSMLEYLNHGSETEKAPLWMFAKALLNASSDEHNIAYNALLKFAENFRVNRNLPHDQSLPPSNAINALQLLLSYAVRQFAIGTGRHRVQQQYMEVFVDEVAKNFVQTRGRVGKSLVINQDFILVLTRLAIADRKSLRFQELIHEFRERGFYFDKSSQQALISFYERVGNVDRKSDSGDAVYVRSAF